MYSNGGNVPRNSISEMLSKNRQGPNFCSYEMRSQPIAQRSYESTRMATHPPIPKKIDPPFPDEISPLIGVVEKKEKDNYVIGETKEEIIENIITKKPSVSNVRKALTKYAEIVTEEPLF